MTVEQKVLAFRELFLIRDFGDFLNFKRDKGELMDSPNSFSMLFEALTKEDIR